MRIIKPSFKLLTPMRGVDSLKLIERVARTCYKSEDKIGSLVQCKDCKIIRDVKFCMSPKSKYCAKIQVDSELFPELGIPSHFDMIYKLIAKQHFAMIEFGNDITVQFICDRGVSHELVRHRLASFAQESTRFCNYTKAKFDGSITLIHPRGLSKAQITARNNHFWDVQRLYDAEIDAGIAPQIARGLLPNALKTEINIKANLREWRKILSLRTPHAAHPQMRELMKPLLIKFKKGIPIIYDKIENYE